MRAQMVITFVEGLSTAGDDERAWTHGKSSQGGRRGKRSDKPNMDDHTNLSQKEAAQRAGICNTKKKKDTALRVANSCSLLDAAL